MSHRTSVPTHEEARSMVCLICGEKGSCKISQGLLENIRETLVPDYNLSNPILPCALCSTHQKALYERKRGNTTRKLEMQDLDKYYSARWTRGSCEDHVCAICSTARSNPVGQSGNRTVKKRGRPSTKENDTPSKVCPYCFGPLGKGLSHTCTSAARMDNTLSRFSPRSKDKLCSSILKDRSREEGVSQMSLATTSGKCLPVTLFRGTDEEENKQSMSVQDLCRLQLNTNLSGKFYFDYIHM